MKKHLFQVQFEAPLRPRTDYKPQDKKCPHCYNCSQKGHYGYVSICLKESFYLYLELSFTACSLSALCLLLCIPPLIIISLFVQLLISGHDVDSL